VRRLAAGVDVIGLTCHRLQCALLHASFLPVACKRVKRCGSEISLEVSLHKSQDFNLNFLTSPLRATAAAMKQSSTGKHVRNSAVIDQNASNAGHSQ
jgi:hypothetical protein